MSSYGVFDRHKFFTTFTVQKIVWTIILPIDFQNRDISEKEKTVLNGCLRQIAPKFFRHLKRTFASTIQTIDPFKTQSIFKTETCRCFFSTLRSEVRRRIFPSQCFDRFFDSISQLT